jgi:hypothetical protein
MMGPKYYDMPILKCNLKLKLHETLQDKYNTEKLELQFCS